MLNFDESLFTVIDVEELIQNYSKNDRCNKNSFNLTKNTGNCAPNSTTEAKIPALCKTNPDVNANCEDFKFKFKRKNTTMLSLKKLKNDKFCSREVSSSTENSAELFVSPKKIRIEETEECISNSTTSCTEKVVDIERDPFVDSHPDELSELCKSSQFIHQIEKALSNCESIETGQNVQYVSEDPAISNSSKQNQASSGNFSQSTTSVPATITSTSHPSTSKENVPVGNPNWEASFCDIAGELFDTSDIFKLSQDNPEYRKQVTAAFDSLENTILEQGVPSSVTMNAINWDETMTRTQAQSNNYIEIGPFYGLPAKVKYLLGQFKGIDKLYDWQHECLQLDAIHRRKNLVYSLPTSGGKTLVSEILMMREVLCRRRNALLVLPYVSIVQEKVWTLAPFAVALDFLLEEYAAGRGRYPPRRRRQKRSVYVATIEKALGLVNSLIESGRLDELGLVVVDELHLVGEEGRGATLELLLTKILNSKKNIQIVGMSATIGNMPELCKFLNAELFSTDFRPVNLEEFVCCDTQLARHEKGTFKSLGKIGKERSDILIKHDPDGIGVLVSEAVPDGSCLVFCPTKKNCENVALLLSKVLDRKLLEHNHTQKAELIKTLEMEGTMCNILARTLPLGIAYHHSGLTMDERRSIEEAFRNGVICVICCTSTLAAGVNLPAKRVVIRSPYVGLEFISLARYKQMVGRAGRAGLSEVGQSILVCEKKDVNRVIELLNSPMDAACSRLADNECRGLKGLLLSCIALDTATTRRELQCLANHTLMAVQAETLQLDVKSLTDQTISDLFKNGALQAEDIGVVNTSVAIESSGMVEEANRRQIVLKKDAKLNISRLGRAAIKGGLDMNRAKLLYQDLTKAQEGLVLLDCLHLLYLVTPYDLAENLHPAPLVYYRLYTGLNASQLTTANAIGITEACAVSLISGNRRRSVTHDRILNKFYLTLILNDLWNGCPISQTAERFQVSRGLVQQLMTSSATFASNLIHFCSELEEFWAFTELLHVMSDRLQHCSAKELLPLMELPSVKLARAKQLYAAGFRTLQAVARAEPEQLAQNIEYMPRRLAAQLIATAKLLLLEKVDNLREEAQDVLEGIGQD